MGGVTFLRNTILIVLAAIIVLAAGQENVELSCYSCNETWAEACGEVFDSKVFITEKCKTLNFKQIPRQSDFQKELGSAIVRTVFDVDERIKPRTVFVYECIKFSTKKGYERNCIVKPANIADSCDFLRKEGDGILTCNTCTEDGCNGATSNNLMIPASFMLLFTLLLKMA